MVNTIAKQTLVDGARNLVVKVQITGDGSGEESATQLIDVSSYNDSPSRVKIKRIQASLTGFSMTLDWDATADLNALEIPAGEMDHDYSKFGGLINNAGAGVTGDIMFTTVGLGAGDEGTILLEMQKS